MKLELIQEISIKDGTWFKVACGDFKYFTQDKDRALEVYNRISKNPEAVNDQKIILKSEEISVNS